MTKGVVLPDGNQVIGVQAQLLPVGHLPHAEIGIIGPVYNLGHGHKLCQRGDGCGRRGVCRFKVEQTNLALDTLGAKSLMFGRAP